MSDRFWIKASSAPGVKGVPTLAGSGGVTHNMDKPTLCMALSGLIGNIYCEATLKPGPPRLSQLIYQRGKM